MRARAPAWARARDRLAVRWRRRRCQLGEALKWCVRAVATDRPWWALVRCPERPSAEATTSVAAAVAAARTATETRNLVRTATPWELRTATDGIRLADRQASAPAWSPTILCQDRGAARAHDLKPVETV